MAKLTQAMKDLIGAQQCFVATVNEDGTPNLGPKRSTRVLDDEHLMFAEATAKRTWANIERGSAVAIAVVDRDAMKGYRFEGSPELITAGPIFDKTQEALRQRGIAAPLRAVVTVKINKIYNLGMPNPGEEIV
jgi:predicted pyridoxine 5'-phosphate oxidase superfamily flavin-nucleotide-binding protein